MTIKNFCAFIFEIVRNLCVFTVICVITSIIYTTNIRQLFDIKKLLRIYFQIVLKLTFVNMTSIYI